MPRGTQRRQSRRQEPHNVLAKIGEFLRGDGVPEVNIAAYLKRVEQDYSDILPWLSPARSCHRFLDIGCGLGGHAAMLAAHYPRATPHLLDGKANRTKGPMDGGFHSQAEPWINTYRAARLLSFCSDEVDSRVWTYPEVLETQELICDLVVSFRAWGHHFPVSVYLPLLERSLMPGGRIILDVRNGTDGLKQLVSSGLFKILGEISQQSTKCRRVVLEKP